MPLSTDFESMFDLAPVSLWLEDYSGLKRLFDGWRAEGVTDLGTHLAAEPSRIAKCISEFKVIRVNETTLALFGAESQDELLGALDVIFRDDMSHSVLRELHALWQGRLDISNETVNYTLDGRRLDVEAHVRVLPGHESVWDRVLVSLHDISARVAASRERAESERYARGLFDRSPVSLWVEDFSAVKRLLDDIRARGITDFATFIKVHPEFVRRCMQEIRVIDVNRDTLRMFGAADTAELLRNITRVFRDEMEDSFADQLQDLWNHKTWQQREVVNYSLSGDLINIHMQFSVLEEHLATWDLVLVSLVDITARKKAEAYLEYLGKHDVLTQLCNRSFYTEELYRLSRKGPWPVSILAIDLNGLKRVNDAAGHVAGDALLRRVGEVLSKAVDSPGWPARIGGDEFSVLLPMTDERGAEAMRERILSMLELNNQFHAGQSGHAVSLSIGMATCSTGDQLEAAVMRADRAMYDDKATHYRSRPVQVLLQPTQEAVGLAKRGGGDQPHFSDPPCTDYQLSERQRFGEGLAQHEFVLAYQPKVDMKLGKVIGFEALVRWNHPERGVLQPEAFIPLIENHVLVEQLGDWAIGEALRQASTWHEAGIRTSVSVNVSPRDLARPDFIACVETHLARHPQLPSGVLELEILETTAIDDFAAIGRMIERCRALGVGAMMDDFGTGYASLTHLRELPVAGVKIDRTFVRGILHDAGDRAIVEGILMMATGLQLKVIAEGVESVAHGHALMTLGCTLAQGYGIAKPLAPEEVPNWIGSFEALPPWGCANAPIL